ncbi:hypothetical protein G3N59_16340 [Paraburkholderia sp. Ac-20340]|uniref:hypothetical protein n=1 Tax=Paraburkholderia sp. Ac-20340 TaxID=2703888 RepID=UPI00197E2843|nr:hypothetical protein [Paraburkholderia sp. Ac-20340]MBN3854952.1 hypothetical protein [Paraburkholderia sp. Ac-20340]
MSEITDIPSKFPTPDDEPPILPSEQSRPFGDAVPAPTEPGLDQPLPPKQPQTEPDPAPQPPQAQPDTDDSDPVPEELSVPIGDAVPTPVEPGLDRPLPPKQREAQ